MVVPTKKTSMFIVLAVLTALLCSPLVKVGQAGSISVGIYDTTGQPKETFNKGESIRIIAVSGDTPLTITVTDPDGKVVHKEIYLWNNYNKTLSNITTKYGWYTVEAESPMDETRKNYASTYLHAVPEIPFGTLGVIATIFLVLGSYGLFRRKKLRYAKSN